jgi:PAS domain S-box-containing protein
MPARLGLRTKMLAFTFGIVVLLVGLSLAVIHYFVARQLQAGIVEQLAKTRSVFERFMDARAGWLRTEGAVVAEDPRFIAILDIPRADLASQSRTVLREARRFQGLIGSDHFIVTDRTGAVLARIDVTSSAGGGLTSAPTVSAARRGETVEGRWSWEGVEYQVASAPLRDGPRLVGTLTVGFAEPVDPKELMEALRNAAAEETLPQALLSPRGSGLTVAIRRVERDLGADLVGVTDQAGAGRGLSVRRATSGGNLSSAPRVAEALQGRESAGLQAEGGRIVQMVVVPVWSRGAVQGTLGIGYEIDDRLAADLRDMTRSEVSFVLDGRVVASTWPDAVRRAVEQVLVAVPGAAGGSGGTGESPQLDERGRIHSARANDAPFEMRLGRENYLSLSGRLEGERGGYLIQRSLSETVGFLTTLERTLVALGLGVLLAAALMSFFGVARIAKPVRALVEGTRRLAAGDLDHRLTVTSGDELGELAGSFNEMAGALATSRDHLEESGRRYRDLFDHAQDVVYTADLQGHVTSMNQSGLRLLGYTAEEVVGRHVYELLDPEDVARVRGEDLRWPPPGPRPAQEVRIVHKDGARTTLEIATRWMVEGGHAVGMHGIGRDITARRVREEAAQRFREQVHESEKLRALGQMAAGVAHNFNNLLGGVIGYAQLMESRPRTPDEYQRFARKIVESAEQCAAVVKRIQTFGRPIDTERRESVDLRRVVRDTMELTKPKWKAGPEREGRTVQVKLALAELPPISSTGAAWEEILSNLVFNAVDAMPAGGTLTIATRREGEEGVLCVSDTGMGMDAGTQRRIFEPFFTTKGPELGTGLGLSTVWGLVQSQGGLIQVQSHPGQGTTFTIRMPLSRAPSAPAPEQPPEASPALRILVIDDEPATRDVLPQMLAGHTVETAGGGAEGLERFRERPHDVVISDWSMPGLSGLDVAAEVKRRSASTVTVLMTGWEVRGTPAAADPHVDLLLAKPIVMRELDRIVAEAALLLRQRVRG